MHCCGFSHEEDGPINPTSPICELSLMIIDEIICNGNLDAVYELVENFDIIDVIAKFSEAVYVVGKGVGINDIN